MAGAVRTSVYSLRPFPTPMNLEHDGRSAATVAAVWGGFAMRRSVVLRISTALAVVATAGTMLVVSGTAATANQGDPILAGIGGQHETGTTQLFQDGNVSGLDVTANTGGRAIGGFSSNGEGLYGQGTIGVYGSGTSRGVHAAGGTYGVLASGDSAGVRGDGGNFGVIGNGRAQGVRGSGGEEGVYGIGSSNGVFGETSDAGGSGVYGQNNATGYGVAGRAWGGTGVLADSANGTALKVSGRAKFSTAGTAVVASGQKKVTVTLAGVTPTDFVLATVQGAGPFFVKNASAGSRQFTIFINKAPTAPATVKVAYFVISAS
jgi:hypothetical protein